MKTGRRNFVIITKRAGNDWRNTIIQSRGLGGPVQLVGVSFSAMYSRVHGVGFVRAEGTARGQKSGL